ncbi:MAG: phospholipid/cholesterol/gamma-HCH transport system substrate-binding protein [Chlamydiales bacterium]|jgi:phospholipid/cholesterol/gamma-HCH transport system substrate-binding protein
MTDQVKNVMIGCFVVVGLALSVWILMFLEPTAGDGSLILRVRFPSIEKVGIGTRVTFAGRHVGEVVAIRQISNAREEEVDSVGNVYTYELFLQVDSSVKVYHTDDIGIHTSGLLGEKSISIVPNPPKAGESLRLVSDEVIYAKAPGSVEETITKFISLAYKAEETMDHVIKLIENNNQEIFFTIKAARNTIQHLDESIEYANEIDLLGSTKKAADAFASTLEKVGTQLQVMEEEGTVKELTAVVRNAKEITDVINQPEQLAAIVENIRSFSEGFKNLEGKVSRSWISMEKSFTDIAQTAGNLRDITQTGKEITESAKVLVQKVERGEGDLGKLLNREDLYFSAKGIMGKMSTVMNDVNHYGLLFHLDKGWQRQRTKRMNVLVNLQTPAQFKDFFEEEVDQISTSLARVAMLMDRMDESNQDSTYTQDFKRGFVELMRQVEALEEVLKIYNQELIEIIE